MFSFYNVITNLKDTPCWIFSRTTDELSDSANYELNNINIILQEDIMKYAKKRKYTPNMAPLFYYRMKDDREMHFYVKTAVYAFSQRS